MPSFIAGRFVSLALSLVAASIVIFLLLEVVPGDPAAFMLGLNSSPEALETLRRALGLDPPALERYFNVTTAVDDEAPLLPLSLPPLTTTPDLSSVRLTLNIVR